MVETNDIDELKALIYSLRAEVERLMGRVKELKAENAELRARLARTRDRQNSANSHKPPASDGYHKKPLIKPALPKAPGKKPGGQAGHPGKTLQMVETPDTIQRHQATHCQQCGLMLTGEEQIVARRQVLIGPATRLPKPRLWVEEHQLIAHQCACGCSQIGQFPDSVAAPVQYGPRIHRTGVPAHSILLNVDYRVTCLKVSQWWAELTGYARFGGPI